MFTNNHAQSLREELKSVHNAYKKEIREKEIEKIEGLIQIERYDEMFDSLKNERERLIDANLRLGVISEQTEKNAEGWKEAALKYQYLFEQMDRIGLQQSEDIFECYKDVKVPHISTREKNKYVTTHLTGSEIVNEVEENVIYDDEDYLNEVIHRLTDNITNNLNDYSDDYSDNNIDNVEDENDPTINIALNALDIVNDDSNDSDDYNDSNEYEGLNELFTDENESENDDLFILNNITIFSGFQTYIENFVIHNPDNLNNRPNYPRFP